MHKTVVAVCAGALALTLSLVGAAPVTALPADPVDAHILVFANWAVNDLSPDGEVARTITALQGLGGTVTTFDGGDGSDAAWTAALVGIDVLSLPEPENGRLYAPGGGPFMSDAAAVLRAWASAGGQIVTHATWNWRTFYEPLLSYPTGLDFSAGYTIGTGPEPVWELQDHTISGAPTALGYVNGTYALMDYGTWSAELKAIVTPIYATADQQSMAVGSFAVGSGAFVYVAYDWYDDTSASAESVADWVTVLQLATQNFPRRAPAAAPRVPGSRALG